MRSNIIRQLPSSLSGVFAALPTPYGSDGTPAIPVLYPILDFLLGKRITGFCVGGVTGEYAACSVEQRESLFRSVALRVNGRASLILGVGGEHVGQIRRLARVAAEYGAVAVLLPPPFFFRFDLSDLLDFLQQIAGEIPLPVLLYNIPQFTHKLGIHNILRLVNSVPNIVGLKDSAGRFLNLPLIREAKTKTPMVFFIGSDELFVEAFNHAADGAISGIASVCPELILATYEACRSGERKKARLLQQLIEEFSIHGTAFPSSWAIKLALQSRGVKTGSLNWPTGKRMCLKKEKFQEWFTAWSVACDAAYTTEEQESSPKAP